MSQPQQHDWLVQIPDKPDTTQKRQDHRSAHLSHNGPQIESGTIVFGGPTLASHPQSPEEPLKINGSVTLFRAASEDQVWDLLRQDPYAELGVWDLERATVTPMWCAVRKAL